MRTTLLALSLLLLAACRPLPAPPPKLAGSGMDMFAPVKMRLHPLSRILLPATPALSPATSPSTAPNPAPVPAPPMLEARLELSDQFNDPGKGVGSVTLQLFDQPPLLHKGALLSTWSLTIDTPQSNRDHWDRFSRTYLFKFPITVTLPKNRDHLLLVATLTLPNGQSLTDELELPLN